MAWRYHLISRGLAALSRALFVASLFNEGFYIDPKEFDAWTPGWGLLLIGWITLLDGVIAWLANPFIVLGWILFILGRIIAATTSALVAVFLSASFLLCETIITNEAGGHSRIFGYGLGYWLWLASTIVLLVGCLAGAVEVRRSSLAANPDFHP